MTYNVELTDKPDKRGIHHVMIRLHVKEQKPARIQTQIELEGKHWNPKKKWGKWVRSSHLNADKLNQAIIDAHEAVKDAVSAYLLTTPSITPKQAKERFEANRLTLLSDYDPNMLVDPTNSFKANQTKIYTWNSFLTWCGKDMAIENLTVDLINSFVRHLLAQGKKNRTVNTYISDLRILYTRLQSLRGLSNRETLAASPFVDWKNLKVVETKKGRLHKVGINTLASVAFDLRRSNNPKYTRSNLADWARWCWLAAHYMAGMRIGDLIRARYDWFVLDSDGYPVRLNYQMQKNGKQINIPLSSTAQQHLGLIWKVGSPPETYLLPYLDQKADYAPYRTYEQIKTMPKPIAQKLVSRVASVSALLNVGLKKAAADLNIQMVGGGVLTNHTARHSFADKIRLAIKNGKTDAKGRPVTNFDAKDLLGHSFMSTTEGYFGDMDQEMLDSAMDALNEE